jgi:hypothetical protein
MATRLVPEAFATLSLTGKSFDRKAILSDECSARLLPRSAGGASSGHCGRLSETTRQSQRAFSTAAWPSGMSPIR